MPSPVKSLAALTLCLSLTACRRSAFPDVPSGYREFAYVSNGAANTVSVLDLVYLRQDRTLQVGTNPSGLAVNPVRNEVYVVNSGAPGQNGSISVIDAEANNVVATIPVHRLPYSIAVDPQGQRAYVANSGSNTVSVIDLNKHREVQTAGTGEGPGLVRISPDARTLLVTNRTSNSVSLFSVAPADTPGITAINPILRLRAAFSGCPGATDAVILPQSEKAFIACSGGHQVMALALAAAPDSWVVKQDSAALTDHLLTFLDVGQSPVHIAMKPDGGELFVSNFASDSISELSTWTNEVSSTYTIGAKPVRALVSADNATLFVSTFGADSISIYNIDDGKLDRIVHTGAAPDALAFSTDEHLLLIADAHSGDVAVIRTNGKLGPALFTMLPAGNAPNDIAIKSFTTKP